MKNTLVLCFACCFTLSVWAQKKNATILITYEEVMKSNDTKAIAGFIKTNPNHPNIAEIKSKLIGLIAPNPEPRFAERNMEKKYNSSNEKNKKTAELLSNLLNEDKNAKEAVLLIENKSKCAFTLRFNGNKIYSIDVPARGKNHIQIPKGTYALSANVCNAKYSTIKTISSNLSLALNDK
ncbi:MAG: hypothetical protein JSS94_06860 [Bacteroidetes bacterium]|nr:hypothetical protein [Bacteroidota bacterium]